jgi:hypothetical protein
VPATTVITDVPPVEVTILSVWVVPDVGVTAGTRVKVHVPVGGISVPPVAQLEAIEDCT